MVTIFEQVFILFIFVAAGFLLGKCNIVNPGHSKILSSILVYVFLPCNIFRTFATNFTLTYVAGNYTMLITAAILVSALFLASYFGAKLFAKEKYERNLFEYSLLVPNYGYMGYALAEALMGETGLMNIMTFALPFSLYVYTVGFAKLTKRELSVRKLFNSVNIATVLGVTVGLCGITLPNVVSTVVTKASSAMAPVSMLLTGIVLAEQPIKRVIGNKKIYPLAAMRLVLIPLAVGFLLSGFCDSATVQTAVLFLALPCGLNTVVFPKLVDESCEFGAGIALVTTVFVCVTLPVVLSLFGVGL